MKALRFFWAASALAVLAVGLQLSSLGRDRSAMTLYVRAVRMQQPNDPSIREQIAHERTMAGFFGVAGLLSCAASVGAVWGSLRLCRKDGGRIGHFVHDEALEGIPSQNPPPVR